MEEKIDMDKVDDVMLPGFRFHPTDEELVGFYLQRKVQQRSLPIELIKQVDIYKYDPWELPKLASTGEKEWYFYCPRDRKYRNSSRPNRVTRGGFWKATGTDRPVYSSDGTRYIGLKKSLVFYRGRAAKGFKTDWMMHEFRLPSVSNSQPLEKPLDKSFPAHDSWALCRIFKKTSSMARRSQLSHSWASSAVPAMFTHDLQCSFSPENISSGTEIASAIQFCCNNTPELEQQQSSIPNFPSSARSPIFPFSDGEIPGGFMFPSSASLSNNASEGVAEFEGFSMTLPRDVQRYLDTEDEEEGEDLARSEKNMAANQVVSQWGTTRSLGFPFNLPANDNAWRPWDSPPCPSEMSASVVSQANVTTIT